MIEIKNLTKTYEKSSRALKNVNITIEDGEFVFVTGRSGSGKSTLMKILLKEVEPTSGRRNRKRYGSGKDGTEAMYPNTARRLGVVFQDFRLLKDKTVYENVAFAQRVIGVSSRRIRESVPQMLKMVGAVFKIQVLPPPAFGRRAAAGGDRPGADQ